MCPLMAMGVVHWRIPVQLPPLYRIAAVSPSMPYSSDAVVPAVACDMLPATHTIGLLLPSVVVTRGDALRFLIVPASFIAGPPMVVHQFWVTLMGLPGVTVRPMRTARAGSAFEPAGHPMYGPRSTVTATWIPLAVV